MGLSHAGSLWGLSRAAGLSDSRSSTLGLITLEVKHPGKLSAGNPHAQFEVAGAGNLCTVTLVRHSQRKRRATDRRHLRHQAPDPDPTKTWPRRGDRFCKTSVQRGERF
jgi:hypothetical protein